jgi:hypothetical protein
MELVRIDFRGVEEFDPVVKGDIEQVPGFVNVSVPRLGEEAVPPKIIVRNGRDFEVTDRDSGIPSAFPFGSYCG